MKIHEYQAKEILRKFGVAVPRGYLAVTPLEAEGAARQLGGGICAVKAQIHAGGRGKGGGVRLARSPDEARQHAEEMLGMMLKTPQTGPEGQEVRKVYIEEGCRIARELYLGMTLDREVGRLAVMASTEGGVDIEEVAQSHPEKILREWIDPLTGLMPYQARRLAFGLGLTGESVSQFVRFATGLYNAYVATDASLAEINPLVITVGGEVLALDAKMNFDDNALYRHAEHRRDARSGRGGSQGDAGEGVRPLVHRARRRHRLHGERRRPRDGDDGRHQALRRAPGELPRRRRRRRRGQGHGGLQDHPLRPGGQGGARQHLRRHHEV